MDVFYYTTSFFITTKPILVYFQIIVEKTYRKSNSSYDNISHVKEAFTFGVTAAKKNNKNKKGEISGEIERLNAKCFGTKKI